MKACSLTATDGNGDGQIDSADCFISAADFGSTG